MDKRKVLKNKVMNQNESIEIDMGHSSYFSSEGIKSRRYKVSDYDSKITNLYHSDKRHSYIINKDVLSADVIINLPKPKCHRLAGMTGAIKNFVGITADKACLPHRSIGSKVQGGDEYLMNSMLKRIIGRVLDQKIFFERIKCYWLSLLMRIIYGFLFKLMILISKDKFLLGSWYGNDTIWRTSLDLYKIILYSDKSGEMNYLKKRKIFNFADMIIAGQGNGPIAPDPKELGLILAGYDAVLMDRVICDIMGFSYKKIPSVLNSINDSTISDRLSDNYLIRSNIKEFDNMDITEFKPLEKWRFIPHDSWKGFI